jgi:hypothetical protein
MTCGDNRLLIVQAGGTFIATMDYRDENGQLIPMPPKARGSFQQVDDTTPVLSFSSMAGQVRVNDPGDGLGSIEIAAADTGVLAIGNQRTDLVLVLELYDDTVSPEYVVQFPPRLFLALPDRTA